MVPIKQSIIKWIRYFVGTDERAGGTHIVELGFVLWSLVRVCRRSTDLHLLLNIQKSVAQSCATLFKAIMKLFYSLCIILVLVTALRTRAILSKLYTA